jgi:16S rRNA (guanine966-N2)-methyltransferase
VRLRRAQPAVAARPRREPRRPRRGDAEARVRRGDALRFVEALGPLAYDVAFADPPYATDAAARVAARWAEVPFAAVLGVEHDARAAMPPGGDTRRYGATAITFYRAP